jgi:ElaA protein
MTSSADIRWRWFAWRELDSDTLHAFLKLRSDIFVVEQNCVFSEMDGADPACEHLCGRDASGALRVYLRLVPPGVKVPQPALGRLVVTPDARKAGLARAAMLDGIRRCRERYPGQPIFLAAQGQLEPFYRSLGFETTGGIYMEDGIPHVNMLLRA